MEEARAYMAQILRTMADKLESEANPATFVNMTPTSFTITLGAATISVQGEPAGTALQPPFVL